MASSTMPGACVCRPKAICMSQSTPIVEYKVFNPDGILHNQGGRSRCTSTSTSSGIQPKWKLAYCRQYFKMHQSLHSRWKLHIRQYGSGCLQGFAGIAIDQDGYCLVGDYDGKSLTIFDSQGNLVHFPKLSSLGSYS